MTWAQAKQLHWPYDRGSKPTRKDGATITIEPMIPGEEEYSGCFTVSEEPPRWYTRRRHGPACSERAKAGHACLNTAAAFGVCVSHLRAIGGHLWGCAPHMREYDRWRGICRACGATQQLGNVLGLCPARAHLHPPEAAE